MKLRYLILFFVILFLIGGILQAKAAKLKDFVERYTEFENFSGSCGMVIQDGTYLLHGTKQNEICYFSIDNKYTFLSTKRLESKVFAISLSSNNYNQKLALGCSNGIIWVQDFRDLKQSKLKGARILEGHNKSDVTAVAFSPDKQTLASGAEDGTIVLWDTVAAKQLFPLSGHKKAVNTVAFSPDGKYLVSGAADGSVKLWDLFYQQELSSPIGHEGAVYTVAFSPDNQMIASGGEDGLIKLWPISNSNELNGTKLTSPKLLDTPHGHVKTIAFSPDGIHLASGGLSGTVFLWNVQKGERIDMKERFRRQKETGILKIENLDQLFADIHGEDLLSIAFSPTGREFFSISKKRPAKWKLSAIGINPESLVRARKPSPLIEKIKGQDKIPPIVNIPKDVTVPAETTHFTVSGTATDALSGIESVTVRGEKVPVDENGKFSKDVYGLKEGENEIHIVATDGKGNESDKITLTITRQSAPDKIAPTVEVENPEFEGKNVATVEYNQKEFQLRVTATDDKSGVKEVRVNVNGIPAEVQAENGQFIAKVPLTKEENKIRIVAEDNSESKNKSEVKEITIRRQSAPDKIAPTVEVENPEFEDDNVATVEYNQKEFQLRVTATDDKSGVNEVRVNGIPAEFQAENGQFIAKVPLNEKETKIRIVAEDNSENKNKSEVKEITIQRKPEPEPIISPIPPPDPVVDKNAGKQSEQSSQLDTATTERSTPPPVTIHIIEPDTIENQAGPLRAYPEDERTCEVSGVVKNPQLASSHIDIIVKSKTEGSIKKPFEDSVRLKVGTFKFKDLPLFPGENEITLKIDLKDGTTPITERFLIQRTSSQSPDRPIQPPGPVAPPTRSPIEQKNKPPELSISLHVGERPTKGTGGNNQDDIQKVTDNQDDVHEETEISKQNTDRKTINTTKEKVLFEGKVYDDTTTLSDIDLKIGAEPVNIQEDGTFKHPYELEYGENQITITARDKDEKVTKEDYTVYYRPDRDGKDFALFFAMEKYKQNEQVKEENWDVLKTPIDDTSAIAEILREEYGFKTKIIPNPEILEVKINLEAYREEFIDEGGTRFEYDEDSQLLIFFSGHGFSQKKILKIDGGDKEEVVGYIACVDSVAPQKNKHAAAGSSLAFEFVRKKISEFHPGRILVLVDTCESGDFDPTFRGDKGQENAISPNDPKEKIKSVLSKRSRWFMTATSEGSVDDGIDGLEKIVNHKRTEYHLPSPFAKGFIAALKTRGNEDYLLEIDEVGKVIKEESMAHYDPENKNPSKVPKPRVGQFTGGEDDGGFIFIPLPPFLKE